jgi:hypothetical protein
MYAVEGHLVVLYKKIVRGNVSGLWLRCSATSIPLRIGRAYGLASRQTEAGGRMPTKYHATMLPGMDEGPGSHSPGLCPSTCPRPISRRPGPDVP